MTFYKNVLCLNNNVTQYHSVYIAFLDGSVYKYVKAN